MTLRMVTDEPPSSDSAEAGRVLAPHAPASPGPLPLELARHLHFGEAVIWWGSKDRYDGRAITLVATIVATVLAAATAFAPEFWAQPLESLWRPLAALASPLLFMIARERANLRATIVTDTAVIDVPLHGRGDRIGFDNIRRVRRDWLRGGARLEGVRHGVRIPPALMDSARAAIASQRRGQFRAIPGGVDDPLGWLP